MIITCFNVDFDISNPIITIGTLSFDLRKVNENTHEGELARLYLNTLGWAEQTKVLIADQTDYIQTIPARIGIDLATATYDEIHIYLNNTTEKMSESLKELLRKTMKIKDKTKFKHEVSIVTEPFKNEYAMIDREEQSIETLGSCGGGKLGKVRLDGSTKIIPRRVV